MASSVGQMQREIQSLTDKLAAAKAGTSKGARKKKLEPISPSVVTSGNSGGGRKKKGRKGKVNSAGQGIITFSRKEKVADVFFAASKLEGSGFFDILPSSLEFLKQFSMFDKVRWNKLNLFYRPGVGATFNGFVSYGVLWDFNKNTCTRSDISALTPNMSHALWFDGQNQTMHLPNAKLQTKPWFSVNDTGDVYEKGPGRVFWAATTSDTATSSRIVGEIWADYSITMTGTSF